MLATGSYVAGDAMKVVGSAAPSPSRPHCNLKRGAPIFSRNAPPGTLFPSGMQRSRSWNPSQSSTAEGGAVGSPGHRSESDENVLEDISTLLRSCEHLKTITESSSSSGVGLDMRNRIDHLLKRVRMLNQSAERAARVAGGRIPSQLIASFKVLQRDHSSVENIVRLATKAGPVLCEEVAKDLGSSGLSMVAPKSSVSMNYEANTVAVEFAEGHENGSIVEVLSGPKYVMSTPLIEGSFKANVVRAEIERRVMEQMSRNQDRFDSKEDSTEDRESKRELQKVSSINQKNLEGDKTDAGRSISTDKRLFPQMGDAELCDQREAEFEARTESLESARTLLLEFYEQMCKRFEKSLSDLKEKYSDVTTGLRQQEDSLLTLKENMIAEQEKLLEKITELSVEVTKRLAVDQSSNELKRAIFDMEENVNRIQDQLVSLESDLKMKGKMLSGWHDQQGKFLEEFQAAISRLDSRLNQREDRFEEFNPQSVLAEIGRVKIALTDLREGQLLEQTVLADWQTKFEHLENSLLRNSQQIKMLTSEVERRVNEGEVKSVLNKVVNGVQMQQSKMQESFECVIAEQMKIASFFGMLEEEWKAHRKELQMQIQDMKEKFTIVDATQSQSLLMEISIIKEKLSEMRLEQKQERFLLSETQQQMVVLENKGLDLLRNMSENAEMQKKDLLGEVRTLLEELLQTSWVHHTETMQGSPTPQQESDANKDVGYVRNSVHSTDSDPSGLDLSAIVPKHDQHMASTEIQGQHVHSKGAASLEAFFSVMGHLIREELKKKDVISALTLPSSDLDQLGKSDHGLSLSHLSNPSHQNADGMEQGKAIVLRYDSNWKKVFIHYCADNLRWTEAPGVAMYEASNPKGTHWKEFRIAAGKLEFVVTDGQGNWDRAPNGHNYLLEKPGTFELKRGVLKAAASF